MNKAHLPICLIFILIGISLHQNCIARDYTTLQLPDGAKSRIGKGYISEIAYSPDGRLLAVGTSIGIWIYDAQTGKEQDLLTGHTDRVSSISFSSDSRKLVSGSLDDTVRIWDVRSRRNLHILTGYTESVQSVSFSPTSSMLATGSLDGTVLLWEDSSDIFTSVKPHSVEPNNKQNTTWGSVKVTKTRKATIRE